jgi:hypothetical protein
MASRLTAHIRARRAKGLTDSALLPGDDPGDFRERQERAPIVRSSGPVVVPAPPPSRRRVSGKAARRAERAAWSADIRRQAREHHVLAGIDEERHAQLEAGLADASIAAPATRTPRAAATQRFTPKKVKVCMSKKPSRTAPAPSSVAADAAAAAIAAIANGARASGIPEQRFAKEMQATAAARASRDEERLREPDQGERDEAARKIGYRSEADLLAKNAASKALDDVRTLKDGTQVRADGAGGFRRVGGQ